LRQGAQPVKGTRNVKGLQKLIIARIGCVKANIASDIAMKKGGILQQ